MTRLTRSRRAGVSLDQPLYARMLRLRHLAPSGFLCFVYLEGAVALAILLALAELVSWWGVLVLPAVVAVMVKLNDVIAGMLARPAVPLAAGRPRAPRAPERRVQPPLRPAFSQVPPLHLPDVPSDGLNIPDPGRPAHPWADQVDVREQMARQSAVRRYE